MDIEGILNEINNAPKHIRDLVVKGLLVTSLGLKKADNELLKMDGDQLADGHTISMKQGGGSLSQNFLSGTVTQQTQEYAERYKMILEKADDFVVDNNGNIRKKNDLDKKQLLESRQNLGSQTTGLPFEMSFENKKVVKNNFEVALGAKPIYSYTTLINRNGDHNFNKLEDVINNAIVRRKSETEKVIELYCNNKAESLEPDYLIKSNIIGFTLMKSTPRGYDTHYFKNNGYMGFEIVRGEIMYRFNCTFITRNLIA